MRGGPITPDAAMRLKQYGLIKLLGWRGYQEIPAPLGDDFTAIIDEEVRQQAEEYDRMKNAMKGIKRR